MRAVERDVIFERKPQLSAQRASNRLQSRPEQPVMHNQQIDLSLLSFGQYAGRNINRRADQRDPARIFDLEPVKRVIPIAYFSNAQKVVGIIDHVRECRHGASLAGLFQTPRQNTHPRCCECLYAVTAKIITRPSMPLTSCGGSSSNVNQSRN